MQMRCKTIGAVVVARDGDHGDHRVRRLRRVRARRSSGPAKGTITLWARDTQKAFMGPLADAYNKSHKAQVKVSIIPSAQFVQKFGTAASSGNAPDVASIDLVFLPYFASQGALADISSLKDEPALQGRPEPGALQARRLGGQDLRAAVHRRGVGALLQQEALQARGPRSQQAAQQLRRDDRGARRRSARSARSTTASCSPARAAAATSSSSPRTSGPAAATSSPRTARRRCSTAPR